MQKKFLLSVLAGLAVVSALIVVSNSIYESMGGGDKPSGSGYTVIETGGRRYQYQHGVFFEQRPEGLVDVPPPVGQLAANLPPGCITVMAEEVAYYYLDGVYFRAVPGGYLIIPESELDLYNNRGIAAALNAVRLSTATPAATPP